MKSSLMTGLPVSQDSTLTEWKQAKAEAKKNFDLSLSLVQKRG